MTWRESRVRGHQDSIPSDGRQVENSHYHGVNEDWKQQTPRMLKWYFIMLFVTILQREWQRISKHRSAREQDVSLVKLVHEMSSEWTAFWRGNMDDCLKKKEHLHLYTNNGANTRTKQR